MNDTLSGLGDAATDARLAKAYPYNFSIAWDSDLATNSSLRKSQRNDGAGHLVVEAVTFSAFYSAVTAGAVAYTPLADGASQTIGSNTQEQYSGLRLSIDLDDKPLFNIPARVRNVAGSATQPLYLPRPLVIPPGATVYATLYNDTARSIQGQLTLMGSRVPIQ